MGIIEQISTYPLWVKIWISILGLTIAAALPFATKDWRARWVLLSMIPVGISMSYLYQVYGFTRVLGLAHVIYWTPLWAYLWKKRNAHPEREWTARYVKLALLVIGISLLFDYADVLRYVLGDRAIQGAG